MLLQGSLTFSITVHYPAKHVTRLSTLPAELVTRLNSLPGWTRYPAGMTTRPSTLPGRTLPDDLTCAYPGRLCRVAYRATRPSFGSYLVPLTISIYLPVGKTHHCLPGRQDIGHDLRAFDAGRHCPLRGSRRTFSTPGGSSERLTLSCHTSE